MLLADKPALSLSLVHILFPCPDFVRYSDAAFQSGATRALPHQAGTGSSLRASACESIARPMVLRPLSTYTVAPAPGTELICYGQQPTAQGP